MSKNKVMRSNDLHLTFEGIWGAKVDKLKCTSKDRPLSYEEVELKSKYEIKERYHKYVRKIQESNKSILPKEKRKKLFKQIYNEYF